MMPVKNFMVRLPAWIYRLLRWSLGGIFIYSAWTKLLAPQTFAVLLDAYGLVPQALLLPMAVMLPALEMVAGIGLLFDIHGSLAAITGLLLLFVAILGYGIRMGLDVDCGCFGPDDPEAQAFHGLQPALYRDLAMLTSAAFLYGWRHLGAVKPVKLTTFMDKLLKKGRTEDAYG